MSSSKTVTATQIVELFGCRTRPLASYLKGLGAFRLLAEQQEGDICLSWKGDHLCLHTSQTQEQIVEWFLEKYRPTPITSPWNGGSGYYPDEEKPKKALDTLVSCGEPRFSDYRQTISECRKALLDLKIEEKPEDPDLKLRLVKKLRSAYHCTNALKWIDTAWVIGEDTLEMVPLLGTGGNDGRLEFSVNFISNLNLLLLGATKKRCNSAALLRSALFDEPCSGFRKGAIGQYDPGSAGGPNTTSGFDGEANVNPWDFVLTLEGTLLFAAAATRKLSINREEFSIPFTVNPTLSVSSPPSAKGDKARCEMWLPTWSNALHLSELRMVFSEGRAQIGNKPAASGVDFARAIASLGTERGLTSFERYTFLLRNGKSYFASPAGTYRIRENDAKQRKAVDSLQEIYPWLDRYRRKAEQHGGAELRRLFRVLDDQIMELCRAATEPTLLPILVTLGKVQKQLARTQKIQQSEIDVEVRPISPLSEQWWPEPKTAELRLAGSLVGLKKIRHYLLPMEGSKWNPGSRDCVWGRSSLCHNLLQVLVRRFLANRENGDHTLTGLELQKWRFDSHSTNFAQPQDIENFLLGEIDDQVLEDSIFALLLLKKRPETLQPYHDWQPLSRLPQCYAILRSVFGTVDPTSTWSQQSEENDLFDKESRWLAPSKPIHLLSARRTQEALAAAQAFLIARGARPKICSHATTLDPLRLGASLAFPVSYLFQAKLWSRASLQTEVTKKPQGET